MASMSRFTMGLFVTALGFLGLTLSLGVLARRTPLVVALVVVFLIAIQLLREHRTSSTAGGAGDAEGRRAAMLAWRAAGWVVLLPVTIQLAGLFAGAAISSFCFARLRGRESVATALVVAGLSTVVVWAIVDVLLSMSPPVSVLARLLG